MNIVSNLIENKNIFSKTFNVFLLIIVLLLILNFTIKNIEIFNGKLIYQKDLIQDYLLAKALQNQVNPYLRIDELLKIFINIPAEFRTPFGHPSPHTPLNILLFYPFVFLPYAWAAFLWFVLELILLFILLKKILVTLNFPKLSSFKFLILYLTIISSGIFLVSSALGQINIILLFLFYQFYALYKKKQEKSAGIILGIIFGLKFLGWPIFLFLLFRKKIKILLAALFSFMVANLLAASLVNGYYILDYYQNVLPYVGEFYRYYYANQSIFVLSQKLFIGQGYVDPQIGAVFFEPLWSKPELATYSNFIIFVCLFLAIRQIAKKVYSFDLCFNICLVLSLFANPIAWEHYLLMIIFPLIITWKILSDQGFPKNESNLFFVITILFYFGNFPFEHIIQGQKTISFCLGLNSLMPLFLSLACCFYWYKLNNKLKTSHE